MAILNFWQGFRTPSRFVLWPEQVYSAHDRADQGELLQGTTSRIGASDDRDAINTDSRNNINGSIGNDVFNVNFGNRGSINKLNGRTGTNQVNLQGEGWQAGTSDNQEYRIMNPISVRGRSYFRNTNINVNSPNGNVRNPESGFRTDKAIPPLLWRDYSVQSE